MNPASASPSQHLTIGECVICSRLKSVETSFSKYGWDEMTRPFPPEVAQLKRPENFDSPDVDAHHIRTCPLCGTFYQYDYSYEYLVNGSEDEEVLTRLTPTQAKAVIPVVDYDHLLRMAAADLSHPNPLTRSYAAQCLVSDYLERHAAEAIGNLLVHPDRAVVEGALFFLRGLVARGERPPELTALRHTLEVISSGSDDQLAPAATFLRASAVA